MDRDYSYDYEWDSEYCYPESNVLINKLNIQSAEDLSIAEREITAIRLAMARAEPIKGSFDLKHLQKIHKAIFGDIYTWAGKLRHVNIAKGNQFCLAMNLEVYAANLFRKLENERYLIGYEGSVPHRLAYYLSEINVLHPFREGNGRTQRLFIDYLAMIAGYRLDFSCVTPREMIIASADSFACDYRCINEMFDRIAAPISKEDQKEAIKFLWKKSNTTFETSIVLSVHKKRTSERMSFLFSVKSERDWKPSNADVRWHLLAAGLDGSNSKHFSEGETVIKSRLAVRHL